MSERSYRQFCGLTRALDVIGDRWNLLIVRNLILGPQTWGELRDHLPGIAKNLLSARLRALEANGVLTHDEERYALTKSGRALESAVFALAAWGEQRHPFRPKANDAIRLRYFMTSLKMRLRPTKARETLRLNVEGHGFRIRLGNCPDVSQDSAAAGLPVSFADLRGLVLGGKQQANPQLAKLAKAIVC